MTTGEKIRNIRFEKSMTQHAFAESLGISRSRLSKIESNEENACKTLLLLISKMYQADYTDLTSDNDSFTCEPVEEQEGGEVWGGYCPGINLNKLDEAINAASDRIRFVAHRSTDYQGLAQMMSSMAELLAARASISGQ